MSANNHRLNLISDNGKTTPAGLKRELADYLATHATPAITATIEHITGSRITITAPTAQEVAHLLQATLTPQNLVQNNL